MNVVELKDISIESGAPVPKVLSSDSELYIIFYSAEDKDGMTEDIVQRDSVDDKGVTIVQFNRVLSYKFGSPNDETFTGHPLYKKGLKIYVAQYLSESPWIDELVKIDSIHPYHNPSKFKDYKHYIFSFHDKTFECIAQGYKAKYKNMKMYDAAVSVLQELFIKEF